MNIAYIWQYERADFNKVAASPLHIKAVIRALAERGHNVRLVTFHEGKPAWTEDLQVWHYLKPSESRSQYFHQAEKVIRGIQNRLGLPYANLFESIHFADAMMPALTDQDIIYERYTVQGTAGAISGRRLGIPNVLELNGDVFEEYGDLGIELSRAQWALTNWLTKRLFQNSSHLVTVSESLRQSTIRQWEIVPEKTTTVINGVEIDTFTKSMNRMPADVIDLPTWKKNGQPIITHVGNFKPWHSIDLLVVSFAQLVNSTPAQLVLVGDGQLRQEVETLVKQLGIEGNVSFLGSIPHEMVGAVLEQSDIAVMAHPPTTSASSGTPLKLLEYMAAGKAIVAPNLRNISEVVEDGVTALLYEAGSIEGITYALMQMIENPDLRRKLGNAAHEKAKSQHSWVGVARQLEAIFSKLTLPVSQHAYS